MLFRSMEIMKQTHLELLAIIDEALKAQDEGCRKRQQAESELLKINQETNS